MGVSGCGKSTLGAALAEALGLPFVEGDELHPPANVAKMAAGIPLTDADRDGWLATIAARLSDSTAVQRGVVLSCSALKRAYRDRLRAAAPGLRFVHPSADASVLEARMAQRTGHYMPPSLLPSQLRTLEPPAPDEHAISLDATQPPDALLRQALARLTTVPTP